MAASDSDSGSASDTSADERQAPQPEALTKLVIIGLGDLSAPSEARRNAGKTALWYLAEVWDAVFKHNASLDADIATHALVMSARRTVQVTLVSPRGYLAHSGAHVQRILSALSAPLESVLLLYPDLRTTIARYRISFTGSASDPGLPDVFEALRTNHLARVGLGINGVHSTASLEEWESFIGTNFAAEELTLFRGRALPRIRDGVRLFLEGKFNPRPPFRVRWVRGSHYECGERIGEGKFGAVFAARDTRTGAPVVLKMLKRARDLERKIAAEVAMLTAVRGAVNVVRLIETAVIEDDEYRDEAMVFELVDSVSHKELFPMLTPALMRVYVYKLLQALAAVHALGVVHLDVKPSNILFNPRTLEFRLIDWGLAIYHTDGVPNHGPLGTRCFKAPELCLRYDLYGPPVDLWAVGCTLGSMLLIGDDGAQPFFKARGSWSQQLLAIVRIVGSDALFAAMDRLGLGLHLQPDEAAALRGWRRVEWREMIRPSNEHLACEDGFALLTRLLDCDCETRVTAKEALAFAFFDSVR